ncbi:MAG: hypothetical protein IKX88_13645 [Thermoguttaceae bacterium]|nr:hypothetical protein [Thermoguttaceae bacterium]
MNEKGILTVGVTGRRHIVPEALEAVETSARLFLQEVLRAHSGDEVRLCTGLAVGADSLIAKLAFKERERNSNAKLRVVAVLPADLTRYERDFKTNPDASGKSELDAFRELLAQCDETICLANPEEDAADPTAPYVRLGEWLVENSDVLLAFWNGNASVVKRGGTVDVVLRKAKRCQEDGSRVYCISTPELMRKKNPDGSKTYVPEPIDGAGNVAILTDAFDEKTTVWRSPR